MTDRELFIEVIRTDLLTFVKMVFITLNPGKTFVHGKHIDALLWHLEECRKGNIKRLLINMPPRHLKTLIVSISYTTWLLAKNPSEKFISASYGQELTDKIGSDILKILTSDWYQEAFPHVKLSKKKLSTGNLETTKNGAWKGTSVEGVGTGYGCRFLIADDPHKASDIAYPNLLQKTADWFLGTMMTRHDDLETGVTIVVMQRLHPDDLSGVVLKKWGWTHLCLPLIAKEYQKIQIGSDPEDFWERNEGDLLLEARVDRAKADELLGDMGLAHFNAQYQQRPEYNHAGMITRDMIQNHNLAGRRLNKRDRVVQSWDTASEKNKTSSYSVCLTWLIADEKFFLVDVFKDNVHIKALEEAYVELAFKWRPDAILIEKASSGIALLQLACKHKSRVTARVVPITPTKSKTERWFEHANLFAEGRVHVPLAADWAENYIQEICGFPNLKHDDQVDSSSQFFKWMETAKFGPPHDDNRSLGRRITMQNARPAVNSRDSLGRRITRW